jgi:homoserine dehydrogenase
LRIGLAGLGVVGTEVARWLLAEHEALSAQAGKALTITAYCTRDPHKNRGIDLSHLPWVETPAALAARDDVDVVVELMGGADGAVYAGALATLKAGKPLVTANKAMLAKHWQELFDLSRRHHAAIMFEASVGGGIPVVKVLREGLAGNRITRISGILNGTCNYILSAMETRGINFAEALKEAQNLGYAEADPTLDIDGWDASHKLLVLAKLGLDPEATQEQITVRGIRELTLKDVQTARAKNQKIRLISSAGHAPDGGLDIRVEPVWLDAVHPLASIMDTTNAINIEARPVSSLTLVGPGAGGGPTASAVLSDIIDLARFDIILEGPLYLPR